MASLPGAATTCGQLTFTTSSTKRRKVTEPRKAGGSSTSASSSRDRHSSAHDPLPDNHSLTTHPPLPRVKSADSRRSRRSPSTSSSPRYIPSHLRAEVRKKSRKTGRSPTPEHSSTTTTTRSSPSAACADLTLNSDPATGMPGPDNPETSPTGEDVQMRDGPERSSPPAVKRSAADMGGEEDVQHQESDPNPSAQPAKKSGESKNLSETASATQDDEMMGRTRAESVDMMGQEFTKKDIKRTSSSADTGSSGSDSVYPTPSSMSTFTSSSGTREESISQESEHPCHDAPSIDEQVAKVTQMLLQPLQEKQKGYVVSSSWLNRVLSRSSQGPHGDKVDKTAAEGQIGPVDNSDIVLVTDPSTASFKDEAGEPFVPLRPGLQMGEDFEVMPQEAWDLVMKWYGLSERSPAIVRYAHNTNTTGALENFQYELNPPIFTILKLLNSSAGTTVQTLKDKNRTPVKILASRHTQFQAWLRKAKEMASIDMSTKVRVWRILGGLSSGGSSGMVTPAASRSASPAPGATLTANAGNNLTLDVNTFSSLSDAQKEPIEGKDQTMNEKYNGKSTLDLAGLGRDEVIVLEEQTGGPGGGEWISDSIRQAGNRLGVSTTGAKYGSKFKSKSASASGRSSPAPIVTRGRQRKDGKPRGVTGLSNLGNTCYMNSALQCVRSVEELAQYFLRDNYKQDLNPSNPLSHNGEVAKAYAHLLHQIYDENGPSSFAPRHIKQTIGRYGPTFTGYGQQDSQEFLLFLLDGLQEDLNRIQNKPYIEKPDSTDEMVHNGAALKEFADKCWDIYKARNDSVITDLFAGMYKSTVVCPVCDKVSIIFDPFNNLTLQLPIENLWTREIFFFPHRKAPLTMTVEIDKNATVKALKEYVAKKTGTNPQRLIMVEVWKFKFYKMFDNNAIIADSQIATNDDIAIMEVEAVPTNYDPDTRDKSKSFYSMSMAFNRQAEEIPDFDSPKCDRMLVPIFNRVQGTGNRQWESFGAPSYTIITRQEAMDYDSVLRKILGEVATMTTTDILNEEGDRSDTEGPSETSDTVIMKEEDAESADSKIKASSVEGEDGLVDVSMRDATEPSQSSDAMDLCDVDSKKNLPTVLRPGSFIPPSLRNLFDIKYMKSNTEVVPLGYSQIDDGKNFPLLSARVPQPITKRASARDDEGYSGGTDNSPASSDDELAEPTTSVNKTLPKADDSEDSDSSDIFNRYPSNRRSKPKARKKQDRFGNDIDEPEADGGPVIRPGEGIILDWRRDVYNSLFTGDAKTRDEFQGAATWTNIQSLPDPELLNRQQRRQKRKKNGISLGECLDEFGKEEILSENDAWYCPRCKEHRRASKKFELWKTPDILVMHLKRFSANRGFRDKIDVLVDFPIEELDLTGRVAMPEDGKSLVYDLFGVDNHYGGLGGGHYTAYAKSFIDNNWYEYNDSHVSKKTNPTAVVTPAAYLLFYRRRSDRPLGGETLEQITHEANKPVESDESQTESGANSPAGEGRRLGGSSRNGSSSALTGVGAAHQAGDGGLAQDGHQARSDDELPDYSNGLRLGEQSLQGHSNILDGLDTEDDERMDTSRYSFGFNSNSWSFGPASDSGPSQVTAAPPGSYYEGDEDLFDDDAASNKAAEGDMSDTDARLAGLGDMDDDNGGNSPGTLFDDSSIQDIPPPLGADDDQGDELPVVELRVGDEERLI